MIIVKNYHLKHTYLSSTCCGSMLKTEGIREGETEAILAAEEWGAGKDSR